MDFSDPEAAVRAINAWIETNTKGMLKDVLSAGDIDADTQMVLANAIYFKGFISFPLTKIFGRYLEENIR